MGMYNLIRKLGATEQVIAEKLQWEEAKAYKQTYEFIVGEKLTLRKVG